MHPDGCEGFRGEDEGSCGALQDAVLGCQGPEGEETEMPVLWAYARDLLQAPGF